MNDFYMNRKEEKNQYVVYDIVIKKQVYSKDICITNGSLLSIPTVFIITLDLYYSYKRI